MALARRIALNASRITVVPCTPLSDALTEAANHPPYPSTVKMVACPIWSVRTINLISVPTENAWAHLRNARFRNPVHLTRITPVPTTIVSAVPTNAPSRPCVPQPLQSNADPGNARRQLWNVLVEALCIVLTRSQFCALQEDASNSLGNAQTLIPDKESTQLQEDSWSKPAMELRPQWFVPTVVSVILLVPAL